jgi:hypothetical protein
MSSIFTSTGPRSKRSYLTMKDVSGDIFTYTTSFNTQTRVTTGTLTAVGGSVPRGTFLYENGRKLYPGAHPGVNTYMVGVFDPVTFVTGYIDPNSRVFTPMNTDKPVDTAAAEGESGGVFGFDPKTETSDLAQPIFTRGDILAEGSMDISGNAEIHQNLLVDLSGRIVGNFNVSGNFDVSGTSLLKGAVTITNGALTVTNGALTVTNGKLNLDAVGANAICGIGQLTNSVSPAIATTAVNTGSVILLSLKTVGGTNVGALYVNSISDGTSFVVRSTGSDDDSSFSWLIIN